MPKKVKSKARLGTVQNVRRVVLDSLGEPEPADAVSEPTPSLISQVMAEMGRRGGLIGGKRRLETLSGRRRSQIARQAAKARWAKKKKPAA